MKILNYIRKKEIIIYSLTVITLSSIICFISNKLDNPSISILTVFTPSIVAFLLVYATKGKNGIYELFVKQTVRKVAFKWLILSLITIPVLASLAILTSYNFDIFRFEFGSTQLLPQIIVIVLIALGEEYGWRGFLLPKLMVKFNLFYSSIILGLIWGLWHFPAYLIGTGVPLQMNFMVFLLWVVLGTFYMSWMYFYTKSVFTSILIHISANAAFNYLPLLPEFTGTVNIFWIFITYLLVLNALIFYINRKRFFKVYLKR